MTPRQREKRHSRPDNNVGNYRPNGIIPSNIEVGEGAVNVAKTLDGEQMVLHIIFAGSPRSLINQLKPAPVCKFVTQESY